MNNKIKDLLLASHHDLAFRADFFERVLRFQDDPRLIDALIKDGIEEVEPLFNSPYELFYKLNSARSHTRQFLILKGLEERA